MRGLRGGLGKSKTAENLEARDVKFLSTVYCEIV
jgi:hypothetical protein